MPSLTDIQLEDHGKKVFQAMRLICINRLKNVRLRDLNPTASFPTNEHLEVDYLIPYRSYCLIGEITSRTRPNSLRRKYRRFLQHYNFLIGQPHNDDFWLALGVSSDQLTHFRDVNEFRGFFIATEMLQVDINLSDAPNILCFYSNTWKLLEEYTESIGSYARYPFFQGLNILTGTGYRPIRIGEETHSLVRMTNRRIAGRDVSSADIYTFEISPYEILPIAQVFRKDLLPDLSPGLDRNYQRPLLTEKLRKIRLTQLNSSGFTFPNSILVVLSNNSTDENGVLQIPERYGEITIIDGQHRLFSYAHTEVETRLRNNSSIMLTAVKFIGANEESINTSSARIFIEINMNQTSIPSTHLDAIAYPILGETHSRAIAAQVILHTNENENSDRLKGLFETSQTNKGKIKATTILTVLKSITNIDLIERLQRSQSASRQVTRTGYENLFGVNINELSNPDRLIEASVICLNDYFRRVASIFSHDWVRRDRNIGSSLEFTKVFAGFIKLLGTFISEGLNWEGVQDELLKIKKNIMRLRGMSSYNAILFDPNHRHIPDARYSITDNHRFLNRNRRTRISIQTVRPQISN